MGGLEDGVAGDVVDVAAGRDADAADLRGEGVAEVVTVEVERGDDVEVRGAGEHLLERDVGDGVFDEDGSGGEGGFLLFVRGGLALFLLGLFPLGPSVNLVAEDAFSSAVGPVTEGTFRVFHDVALVDDGDALAFVC